MQGQLLTRRKLLYNKKKRLWRRLQETAYIFYILIYLQSTSRAKKSKTFHTSRPVDKQMIIVKKTLAAAQLNSTLFTATFPCTIVGLRWNISIQSAHDASDNIVWCVQIVKEGVTTPTLATSDAATFVTPEANVMTYGVHELGDVANGQMEITDEGHTKSMRKMQGGDKLIFSAKCAQAGNVALLGVVQFFCKG